LKYKILLFGIMELNISEIEDIPENRPVTKAQPIKVVKQQQMQGPSLTRQQQPQQQGVKARMVRPQVPAPKPNVSYDDILERMGMYLDNGQLRLKGKPQTTSSASLTQSSSINPYQSEQVPYQKTPRTKQVHFEDTTNKSAVPLQQSAVPLEQKNSYIYQKYFKNEPAEEQGVRRPQSLQEYQNMLISNILQKHRIKQIKSNKLIMPTSNINFAQGRSGNLNRFFSFSER
jgi:hypothetical protein